ncbi:MAG: long-chain-fatty-acid--CoA ligase [Candidatus Jordarchaeum sp.]|uniref:long-chain-fatty-acid--CoA ligase n=1 Tax=Candidatus Jordarchaeum sp. TaxID=2823881 RepID=UPI00404B283C
MSKNVTYKDKPWLKNYDPGVPEHAEYPEIPDFKLLEQAAKDSADATMLIYQNRKFKYKEINELYNRFATGLAELGLKKGDAVGLHLLNFPQWCISYFGIQKSGGVPVSISPLYTGEELKRQINSCKIETIITFDFFYPVLKQVINQTTIKNLIITNSTEYGDNPQPVQVPKTEAIHFKELVETSPPKPPKIKINPREDPAAIYFTGGTTGVPKGAILTHYNIVANAIQFKLWTQEYWEKGETVIQSMFPNFHTGGLSTLHLVITNQGASVCIPNPRDLDVMLKNFGKYKVNIFAGVPATFMGFLSHPDFEKTDFSSLKICVCGAAAPPPELVKEWETKTGSKVILPYGITEASPMAMSNPWGGIRKNGSVGLPLPDTEAKVVDLATGLEEVPVGGTGELVIRGPQIFKGYLNMPDETAKTLREGWLYTGDIVKMDEDGYFYLVDRKKDMINVSGYHVFGKEIDDVLQEIPSVEFAAAVGVPNPEKPGSELVKVYIVLKPEYEGKVTETEIISYCKEKLAPYKVPKIVEFRKELPTSSIGKILKRALREEAKN